MNNIVVSLTFVRIAVGLFFAMFGWFKLFIAWPDAITQMMANLFWVNNNIALILAWFTIIVELVWGIIILLWNKIPRILHNITLLLFIWINIVWFVVAQVIPDIAMWDMLNQFFWHLQLLLVLIWLLFAPIKCVFWFTWDNK